jgi:formamidopyrimidine-DNA glycosylase
VGPVSRRGKYLWMALGPRPGQGPDDAGGLLLHLGMSGSLGFHAAGSGSPASAPLAPPGPHDHFDLVTTQGTLRLHDPRRFGAVVWSPATPLSFHARLHTHRTALKNVLLSGQAVVGAGNIYACEALFQAGIDPRMRADRLSRPRAARLLQAVRDTLARATAMGGSTLRDFRDAHGMNGEFQAEAAVYGREGQPCPRCATSIRRIVQGQRATYFCPSCQKR